MSELTDKVRAYWEAEACGTAPHIVGDLKPMTREWFEQVEQYRYAMEPFIHSVAQFTRHRGKRLLEVGVGAGTDHLQWARAGLECHGIDLTDAAIATTRARLAEYGFSSQLQRVNAQQIPYADASFDLVYSWGVIMCAEHPENVIAEIWRVLKPGGQFIGMMYSSRSLVALRFWIKHALLAGKPWRSIYDVIYHHMESLGTKPYTNSELRQMFGAIGPVQLVKYLTPYDTARLPGAVARLVPDALGWFVAIRATR
jgi:ubiquinone/menaquinone biosynthesis C-methylase UbiE